MHWEPKRRAASRTTRRTAAVLMETLSAPALQVADVGGVANAAAHGQGHEDPFGGARHHVENDGALVAGGGYVEEGQFIRPLGVVGLGRCHRVAGVPQFHKADALHHPAVSHVQTRHN